MLYDNFLCLTDKVKKRNMAKIHAQRRKEYRERKKAALGNHWMKEESSRTKKYYKKSFNTHQN